MFVKIYKSTFGGTLRDDWRACSTFVLLLVLADRDGVVDMTPSAIVGHTGFPRHVIVPGLKALQAPDPNSRTPDEDGRRIVLIDEHRDWGWVIINYLKYRAIRDADTVRAQTRIRVQKHREQPRGQEAGDTSKRDVTLCNAGNAKKRQAEAEAEAITRATTRVLPAREAAIETGIETLMRQGPMSRHAAQTFIAGLCKLYGDDAVLDKLALLAVNPKVDPRTWLRAALKDTDHAKHHRPGRARSAVDRVRDANPIEPDPTIDTYY